MTWAFEMRRTDEPRGYAARLRFEDAVDIERTGATAADAVLGLLRVAGYIEDPELRAECIAAIRQGLGCPTPT